MAYQVFDGGTRNQCANEPTTASSHLAVYGCETARPHCIAADDDANEAERRDALDGPLPPLT